MSKRLSRELIAGVERLTGVSLGFERLMRRRYVQELALASSVISGTARPTQVGDEILERAVRSVDQPWALKTKRAHKLRKGDVLLIDSFEAGMVEAVRVHRSLFLVLLADGRRVSVGRASDVTVVRA